MIRPATTGDLEDLLAIEEACFDPALYARMSRRQFRRHLSSPRAVLLVAVDDADKAVGYALGFLHEGRSSLRFYSLAVSPRVQRGEVGKSLFERMEEAAFAHGVDVQCEVRADNDKLKSRYAALGYVPYRTVTNYYPDGASCIKYIKFRK